MNRLSDIAREREIHALLGAVLRDEGAMPQMWRELGFTISPEHIDPTLVQLQKRLLAN